MKKAICALVFFLFQNLISQTSSQEFHIIRHEVQMGETVKMLSQKYQTPPSEIYNLNKFAVDGISKGMILQIPVPVKQVPAAEIAQEPVAEQPATDSVVIEAADNPQQQDSPSVTEDSHAISHNVLSGETLSGLAQQYGVSIQDIKQANPKVAKRGLRADETINIPASSGIIPSNDGISTAAEPSVTAGETIEHTVVSGETLSGLAEKYQISIAEIKNQNKKLLKRGLQTGQVLKITKP